MNKPANTFQTVNEEDYVAHPNPAYRGNPLIEVLEQYVDSDLLAEELEWRPEFSVGQRQLPAVYRGQLAMSLAHFYSAIARVIAMARACLDLMMEGYVGREPDSPRYHAVLERRRAKRIGLQYDGEELASASTEEELSFALMGISGAGKSKFLKRFAQLFSEPLYHPKYGIYQVPVIWIRFPPDGRSLHALATSILRALHEKLPQFGYDAKFLRSRQSAGNATERLQAAEDLLHIHCVGLVLVDESQDTIASEVPAKAKNSKSQSSKRSEGPHPVLKLLIAASNTFGIPLIFVGTGELHDVMEQNASLARRCDGYGAEFWDRLPSSGNLEEPDEAEVFLLDLWQYQWLSEYVELTQELATVFLEKTQSLPDAMVRLYIAIQRYVIAEGLETITKEIIAYVYEMKMHTIAESLDVLRRNDPDELALRPEIAPLRLRPNHPNFEQMRQRMIQRNLRKDAGKGT